MKRLILTRHAKSSWDDPLMADHDRPLNPRGRAAATALGRWLASRGNIPGEVLCSDSRRTRETFDLAAAEMPEAPGPVLKSALYHAGPEVMLSVLRRATADVVMMIGHNPGIGEFARRLLSRHPPGNSFSRYPTGATMVADFAGSDWEQVDFGQATLVDFIVPDEAAAR